MALPQSSETSWFLYFYILCFIQDDGQSPKVLNSTECLSRHMGKGKGKSHSMHTIMDTDSIVLL
jgi:hypothetical protein